MSIIPTTWIYTQEDARRFADRIIKQACNRQNNPYQSEGKKMEFQEYNVTCRSCLYQVEGKYDDYEFYFRERHGIWNVHSFEGGRIGRSIATGPWGGNMPDNKAMTIISTAIREWKIEQQTEQSDVRDWHCDKCNMVTTYRYQQLVKIEGCSVCSKPHKYKVMDIVRVKKSSLIGGEKLVNSIKAKVIQIGCLGQLGGSIYVEKAPSARVILEDSGRMALKYMHFNPDDLEPWTEDMSIKTEYQVGYLVRVFSIPKFKRDVKPFKAKVLTIGGFHDFEYSVRETEHIFSVEGELIENSRPFGMNSEDIEPWTEEDKKDEVVQIETLENSGMIKDEWEEKRAKLERNLGSILCEAGPSAVAALSTPPSEYIPDPDVIDTMQTGGKFPWSNDDMQEYIDATHRDRRRK